jgi:AcrR family transcriptional regulator
LIHKIVAGYIELLSTGKDEKISVTTLCSFCKIHRSSFYRYFEDIEDLDEKFLSVLYASRDCAKNFRPKTISEMIDYLVSIVSVMKEHESLFRKSEESLHLLKYRDRWSTIVCDDFLPWWPRNRYSYRHPLLDARLIFSVGLIDTFLDYALASPAGNVRAISFILIEYMTGGRLRAIAKSQDIDREIDEEVDRIYQEELEIFNAANRRAGKKQTIKKR